MHGQFNISAWTAESFSTYRLVGMIAVKYAVSVTKGTAVDSSKVVHEHAGIWHPESFDVSCNLANLANTAWTMSLNPCRCLVYDYLCGSHYLR